MKITKTQLKQIIKEELNEVTDRFGDWLTTKEMEESPPSASVRRAVGPKKRPETEGDYSMGFEPEDEEAPDLFDQLEDLIQDLLDDGNEPEEIIAHVEGALEDIPAPETSGDPRLTSEYMINFYQQNPSAWKSVARNHYYKMATGEWSKKNDPEGVRSKYPHWKRQDFIEVITKVDGSYEP